MSLGWSDDGPALDLGRALGWSDDGPTDPDPDPVLGWTPELWQTAAFSADGTLVVSGYPRLYVPGPQLAADGVLTVSGYPRLYVPGPQLAADGVLAAKAWAKLYASTAADADGVLVATATIPVRGPLAQSGAGTFTAPWWARYADVILLSGGASGQTGNGAIGTAGKGGNPGQWATTTIDLGQYHGPWSITLTGGQGGAQAANSDNAAPNPGGNTTAAWTGAGSLTATGGSGTVASGQNGGTPGIRTYQGIDYTGGAGGTGNAGAGQAPGGAGAGGNGGIFGSRTRGGPGAPGQAWIVFRQN